MQDTVGCMNHGNAGLCLLWTLPTDSRAVQDLVTLGVTIVTAWQMKLPAQDYSMHRQMSCCRRTVTADAAYGHRYGIW